MYVFFASAFFSSFFPPAYHFFPTLVLDEDQNVLLGKRHPSIYRTICLMVFPLLGDFGYSTPWSSFVKHAKSYGSLHYAAPEILDRKPYVGPEVVTPSFPPTALSHTTQHTPHSFTTKGHVELGCVSLYYGHSAVSFRGSQRWCCGGEDSERAME